MSLVLRRFRPHVGEFGFDHEANPDNLPALFNYPVLPCHCRHSSNAGFSPLLIAEQMLLLIIIIIVVILTAKDRERDREFDRRFEQLDVRRQQRRQQQRQQDHFDEADLVNHIDPYHEI